ncbi:hypothetical protein [Pelagibius sp. Alg239-R121]|uniref:hypothetical protein n=1 Tax=Pelagibius sp. Alg239-R121 TaxID=2993448 RepID=UPI0024A79440|nr:hypothetical protein [Pelagibius sp. Alg239-R121]
MDCSQGGAYIIDPEYYPRSSETVIPETFTDAERERFHNLLMLAAESPFEGERNNALAAAKRMADRKGLTLDEAAAMRTQAASAKPQPESPRAETEREKEFNSRFATATHLMDQEIRREKARREAALKAARDRGLDAEERRAAERRSRQIHVNRSNKKARMNPHRHAAVLLRETSLPFREVANITGLDVYQIVGMKLKMRNVA